MTFTDPLVRLAVMWAVGACASLLAAVFNFDGAWPWWAFLAAACTGVAVWLLMVVRRDAAPAAPTEPQEQGVRCE